MYGEVVQTSISKEFEPLVAMYFPGGGYFVHLLSK